MRRRQIGGALGALLVLALAASAQQSAKPTASSVLKARCVSCHGGTKPAGGIDLSKPEALRQNAARIARVVATGQMPPSGKLPPAERSALTAPAAAPSKLWSLAPLKAPPLPTSPFDQLTRTPIDRFIFATLAANQLAPGLPADKRTLLRRVSLDLIGLPPTPEETAAFLADKRPDAYERVVDRLLASPHYGERWGRHWLDVVRFGESNGYERNLIRPNAWPYRDWVVSALNADIPYAQFVTQQLAGDVTGAPVATGFLVAGCHDDVGSPLEELSRSQRASDLDDIVSTTAEAFLGLTVGCARCHDHKFDPVSQQDYYQLCAVFAGVVHGERPLDPPAATAARDTERQVLLTQVAERAQPHGPLNPIGNVETFAPTPARFVRFTIMATVDNAEPCLDELAVFGDDPKINLALGAKVRVSSSLPGYAIHRPEHLNDGKRSNLFSWISNERGAGWVLLELPQVANVQRVLWARDTGGQFGDRRASRYQVAVSVDGQNWTTVASEQDHTAPEKPDPQRDALLEKYTVLRDGQSAYIGQFRAPDTVYFLRRGDVMQRGEPVEPGALAALGSLGAVPASDEPARRKALATWLVRRDNPLTWRVMVNRVWQGHFGVGLVATPSDFGNNGSKPSHPALLDYLATRFRDSGGKLKALHREIVLSYAYRQAVRTEPRAQRRDADNRLLWRGPLRRLDAEGLWDAILATSGTLSPSVGGPPYKLFTYKQENIAFYGPAPSYGPETWRRSLYRMTVRAVRDNFLACFDCPESATRAPKRETTVTPLQAMTLLNGPFVRLHADHFAARVRREVGATPEKQCDRAWLLALGRLPDPDERKLALALLRHDGLPALCRALLNTNEFLYY